MKRFLFIVASIVLAVQCCFAQRLDKIKYGDFNSWVSRQIHESAILGGNKKTVYEIGPSQTIIGNKPYTNLGGSPWGTSNVYAKVSGIVKASNAVDPAVRSGSDRCAKLCTKMERVKALGFINMDVMVAGSIFLGQMIEPVSSTKNPYSKMEMGAVYHNRPKNFVLDYKVDMPNVNARVKSTGFSSKTTLPGHDEAVVFVFLQHRWEDAKGNLHASRVATAGEKFGKKTGWVNGHRIPFVYGDISSRPGMKWLGLRKSNAYYARNSKGKLKPVVEENFDANAEPTHVVVMISAGSGEPYVGTEGLNLYVDNVAFEL